ncbi:MAG TPA: tetratricopeptide repeat protein [Bryobacteraceae bacterium]|nr:tetratricopeptide repeat protein [Bryobacteraceae bacterium]
MRKARSVCVLLYAICLVFMGCAGSPEVRKARFLAIGKTLLQRKEYGKALLEFRNAAQSSPRDPEVYYQIGLAASALENWGMAAQAFRKALELDTQHEGAQLKLAQLMASTTDRPLVEDAHRRLTGLLEQQTEDPSVLTTLALTEWKLARPEDAEAHLRQAFLQFPSNLSSSIALAQIQMAKGDTNSAENILKETAAQTPASGDAIAALGAFYAITGRREQAAKELRRALIVDPKCARALFYLAALHIRNGQSAEAEGCFKRISELREKPYRFLYGAFLLQIGKVDAAITEFKRIRSEKPDDREARGQLVTALVNANREPEAESLLAQVVSKNPRDSDALLERSRFYMNLGRFREAEQDLAGVMRFKPDSSDAHYLKARLYEKKRQPLMRRQALTEALRLRPEFLAARLELAHLLVRRKDARSALATLDAAPRYQKNAPGFIAQRNWALLAANDISEARQSVEAGLTLARTADFLHQSAILNLSERRFEHARKLLREALTVRPEDDAILSSLVKSYLLQKQPQAAVKELREYAAKNARSPVVLIFYGKVLFETGDKQAARAAFEAAKAIGPGLADPDMQLSRLNHSEGKIQEALKFIQAALAADPNHVTARLWKGNLEASKGNHQAAIQDYRAVIEADPDNTMALNNISYFLVEHAGKPDEALKYAQKALELRPADPGTQDTLGWVLYNKGLYGPAVTHLKSAASQEGDVRWKYHLAMAYAKAGDSRNAYATLDAALRFDPSVPEAKRARDLVRTLGAGK